MAVHGAAVVYGGMDACCLAHRTLLLQRSEELGTASSDSPAFSMTWGLPGWPCSYFNPLLSPTENAQIVQGKPVVWLLLHPPASALHSLPLLHSGKEMPPGKDHCTHPQAVPSFRCHQDSSTSVRGGEHVFTA